MAETLLERVLAGLDPEGKGRFCYECGASGVKVLSGVGERYECPNGHVMNRSYYFDGYAAYKVDESRLIHETVGAIVRRHDKMLLYRRNRYPLGFTITCGHRDEGRDPASEMVRKVQEHVNLKVTGARTLWDPPQLLQDACARGADYHLWHLFDVEAEGVVTLAADEATDFGWYTEGEIYDLGTNRLLTPATREIFHRLNIV